MADDLDIDALLDDLDGYCAPEADGSPAPANKADKVAREPGRPVTPGCVVTRNTASKPSPDLDDSLQDILDDLDDIELESHHHDPRPTHTKTTVLHSDSAAPRDTAVTKRTRPVAAAPQTPAQGAAGARCDPALLGGTAVPMGQSVRSNRKACNMLRCIACDFKVCWFDGFVWHKSCDYLFFRNGCTDPARLKPKLVEKAGHRAYACQCAWAAVCDAAPVTTVALADKKWRCLPGTSVHP
eukprot:m.31130 g.31130  ORF g.31130 m.31130 type:complete len:240 (-) comp4776_c0_seq1:1884-2603(-)